MHRTVYRIAALLLASVLILSACGTAKTTTAPPAGTGQSQGSSAPLPSGTSAQPAAVTEEQSAYPDSKLKLDAYRGPVGSKVVVQGTGFPAGEPVRLLWKTFDARFVLEQEEVVFVGPEYKERWVEVAKPTTDASGALRAEFTVSEDFGGVHDLVARVGEKYATRVAYTVTPTFTISTTRGPAGTPLTIKGTGLGWKTQESLWQASWDNGFTGYLIAVNTHGTATAQIRLAGEPGPHVLKIWRNYRGVPYLNPHQGPFGPLPESTFVVEVTEGAYDAPAIWTDPKPEDTVRPTPTPKSQGGATLAVTPEKGTVGSKVTLRGTGFPAGQPVTLSWATRTGQKITNTGLLEGFEEEVKELPSVTAGADGSFSTELTVFDDYAGAHRITATSGDRMAEAYFSIYASIVEFTQRAKVGEDVSIHMKGVGWTIQGKTYAIVYDNVYLGYGCSFSTKGDIDLHLPAAGAPGVHTIDLYPAVYEGRAPTPDIYSKPNLTYIDNHPGGTLPAFRLTLIVEE